MAGRSTSFLVVTVTDKEGKKVEIKDIEVQYFGKVAVDAIVANKKIENSALIAIEPTSAESAGE